MFNFIFEGKIGDMLAPIQSPLQQFHLAIQHQKNPEVEQMILSGAIELGNVSSAGYADIHVACRYNNRYVLNILLSRGIPVNHADKYGNTPLHYAAKYGHIDICRFLVEANCSAAIRNSQGQSAYDVSDNHIIRQYLLPLQLSSERDLNATGGSAMSPPPTSGFLQGGTSLVNSFFPPSNGSTSGIPVYSTPNQYTHPPPSPNQYISSNQTTPYIPPPYPSSSPNIHQLSAATNPSAGPSLVPNQSQSLSQSSTPVLTTPFAGRPNVFLPNLPVGSQSPSPALPESMSPPSIQHSTSGSDLQEIYQSPHHPPPPPVVWNSSTISAAPSSGGSQTITTAAPRRIIQADGFESSASKASLKEKYGHTKIVANVAPPPIFSDSTPPPAMGPPPVYATSTTQPSYLHNRYVVYDPNAAAVPYAPPLAPPVAPVAHQNQMVPPVIQTDSTFLPPSVYGIASPSPSSLPPPPVLPSPPSSSLPLPPPPSSQSQTSDPSPTIITSRLNNSPRVQVNVDNVFNPVTDRVVSATSSSSAIL